MDDLECSSFRSYVEFPELSLAQVENKILTDLLSNLLSCSTGNPLQMALFVLASCRCGIQGAGNVLLG